MLCKVARVKQKGGVGRCGGKGGRSGISKGERHREKTPVHQKVGGGGR